MKGAKGVVRRNLLAPFAAEHHLAVAKRVVGYADVDISPPPLLSTSMSNRSVSSYAREVMEGEKQLYTVRPPKLLGSGLTQLLWIIQFSTAHDNKKLTTWYCDDFV